VTDTATRIIDPIEQEIFTYTVESIVEEIDINITRTAHSPLVYEYKDYCAGLLTKNFELLGQSQSNLPIFLADLGDPVADVIDIIGADSLRAGDVVLTNYGEVSGQHLNHVVAFTPLHSSEGEIQGYLAIRTHWADVGGIAPGSLSWEGTDLRQEGFQVRGLRVMREGNVVPEVVETIRANCYMQTEVVGDLMAQAGACLVAAERWNERVASRWSRDEVRQLVTAQLATSRDLAARAVAELPDGIYEASCTTDDAGASGTEPLRLSVKLIVKGDQMVADLSDLPPQVATPINAGRNGGAMSAMRVAFKALLVPHRQADQGLFEPLSIVLPTGTLLSATDGAPMAHWNTTIPTMVDLFLKAIGDRLPERVPAGHHGSMAMLMLTGRRADGSWVQYVETGNGGHGAHSEGSGFGPLKTLMHGDNRSIPIELVEGSAPVRFRSYKLLRDAGGEGLYNGGPGVERIIELLEPLTLSAGIDRTLDPPWGMNGGKPGQPGGFAILYPGSETWQAISKADLDLPAGALIRQRTSGGGGWGTPLSSN
jgi:N-methylhydantoinase B